MNLAINARLRSHMTTPRLLVAATTVAGLLGGLLAATGPAQASSHREAPLISQDATADNTDVYAFRDPTDPTKLNIIANFIGLEDPAGGPNFTRFGDDVLYEIHINNTGDATDQITYQFRFSTTVSNPNTFLYNTGPVGSFADPNLNVRQTYSVRKLVNQAANGKDKDGKDKDKGKGKPKGKERPANSDDIVSGLPVAPANIGPRSTPNYENALGKPVISTVFNGEKVFAGPRKDPFFVDLGSVFDLLGLRPLNTAHVIPLPTAAGVNAPVGGKNVHEIALQVPIASVTLNGDDPTVVDDSASVVGVYASASRQQVRMFGDGEVRSNGRWVQVSRLGLPLVNEVLIPLGKKDIWNASSPQNDVAAFGQYILNPEPAALMHGLYGLNVPANPRTSDILPILQGAGAGLTPPNYLPPADLLRVNVAVPVNPAPNRLGVLAADGQGFPNGRRLNDDVVDILLRVLAGGTPFTPATNVFPNNALTDGVDASEIQPVSYFPYEAPPIAGYSQPAGVPQP